MSESQKVVITLTTIPSRLHDPNPEGMQACILSLLRQDYEGPYEVHLNIPRVHKHSGEYYRQPDWLKEYRGDRIYTSSTKSRRSLKVFKTPDYGPATKTVPTIARITDPDTLIIVVDDDLIYDERMITAHIGHQTRSDRCAVGYDGLSSYTPVFNDVRDHYVSAQRRDTNVRVLQHYKSVSYRRSFFEDDFEQFVKEHHTWNDDLLISGYMASKGILRIATFHQSDPVVPTLEEWQLCGAAETFPVIRHTNHIAQEGCNLFRQDQNPKINNPDTHKLLYKFVDVNLTEQ